jgi:predicted TIM-barrel fold metal-dependent hydrolase
MDTAFFLVRRHPNVYLDISGIPPRSLLRYFPRLAEVADKTLFGTDWPGPGVPDVGKNLAEFRGLGLGKDAQDQILSRTAMGIWAG